MYPTYVVARSETSYRMFIKRNDLAYYDFKFLENYKGIHEINSGSLLIFLDGAIKRNDYKQIRDTIKLRTDLVRLKEW